ncbi:hypothetical protein [Argonema galeatum]|uniref:hypothetical protein n=1 Tax=Argonema galeatum TaxID=2942762 RepID=UPI002011601E|nr:hypothetical protein [Argonema galeatum]MCL1466866.1 hypothetical protein [Argonema galeatum A003/A1]
MKEKLLYDIFIGFLFLSIWLNLINGYLQFLINNLSDRFKLSLYSFSIIFAPLLADFVFNGSGKGSKTLATAALSSVVTLAVRESFVWWKDRNEIKEEIFSELYDNYRSLKDFVQAYQDFSNMPDVDANFNAGWNRSIESKWIDKAFNNHFGKLQPRKIFSQPVVNDLLDVYQAMQTAINDVKSGGSSFSNSDFMSNIFLGNENYGIIGDIRRLLVDMNEKKANELLTD